jgi:hypothetical protein
MPDQPCSACGGSGSTFKTEYTYELDANGKTVAVARQVYGQCSNCGGSGRIG